MLYVRDSLFLWCAAIHQGNFGVSFLNSAAFSLHLSRDIGHILYDDFSTPNENFSAIKKVSETMSAPETSVELSENQLFDFSISIAGRITKLHLDLHKTVVLSDTVCTAE